VAAAACHEPVGVGCRLVGKGKGEWLRASARVGLKIARGIRRRCRVVLGGAEGEGARKDPRCVFWVTHMNIYTYVLICIYLHIHLYMCGAGVNGGSGGWREKD